MCPVASAPGGPVSEYGRLCHGDRGPRTGRPPPEGARVIYALRWPMDFDILGRIRSVETMAVGRGMRVLRQACRRHGKGRWRKRKGIET